MSLSGEAVLYASSPCEKKAQESAKRERKRRKIVKELFDTEKTYLHHLELVNKFFDFPLRFACLVPNDIHTRLFSNLEQIREVNSTLFVQMEESSIGQAFSQLGPFLKLYSTYANNHQYALTTLQEWQNKSPDFAAFISKQEDRPEVGGLKLNALLITPVQRVPRYKMLLDELLQCTPEDHYDYDKLQEAAKKIADIALHINEYIRQNENFMKMLAIQRSFDSSAPKLLVPGREFIKEGPLRKVSRKGGRSYERMFFLFSDILLYGKPKLLDGGSKSYTCSCVLPLKHCIVEPVFITNFKQADTGGVFKISCKEESLVLYSDDQSNANEWSTTVDKAIRKLCSERQTLRRPSSHKIPLRGRSLRRHRQKQKKTDLKIPGKTPLRPLSQTSNESEEKASPDCSPDVRARLDTVKCRLKKAFNSSHNIPSLAERAKGDRTKNLDLSASHVMSGEETVSLSDTSGSFSDSDRHKVTCQSSIESDDLCQKENVLGAISENQTLTGLPTENPSNQDEDISQLDSIAAIGCKASSSIPRSSSTISVSEEAKICPQHTERSMSLPSTSTSTPYFPPNSPAHKYFQRQSWNMKLRSYFQRPLKRFQKVREEIANPCSPFRSRLVSGKTCPRKSPT